MTRWLHRHPLVGDTALALFLFAVSAPFAANRDAPPNSPLLVLLAFLMCAPLVVRRRHPTGVFAVVAGLGLLQWALDIQLRPNDLAILVALYTVAAYGQRRDAIGATIVALGGTVLASARWHEYFWTALVAPAAITLATFMLGDDIRNRRAYFAGLEERAKRLERERDAQAEIAAAGERARIARELHDVVAHNVSVMVAQADGAAYALDRDPERARRAMATVSDTGRHALAEMRRLLGVLRPAAETPILEPQPGIEQLPELVSRVRDAGLAVRLTVGGERHDLPAGMELAVYRIVQEALTNTMKHAGAGATAAVSVMLGTDHVTVEVCDDGVGTVSPAPPPNPGRGLEGMRERVSIYDGTVRAGPAPGGGFVVSAELPVGAGVT